MDRAIAPRVCHLALAMWFLTPAGCSVLNRENRVLTEQLADHIQPKSVATRLALAPVVVPAGVATLTLDGVLVHPVRMVPLAWQDANRPFGKYWRPATVSGLRKAVLLLPIGPLTALCFTGSWPLRSLGFERTECRETP